MFPLKISIEIEMREGFNLPKDLARNVFLWCFLFYENNPICMPYSNEKPSQWIWQERHI
jgi:hypothetical protein